jgi:hypothetical protein
MNNVAYGLLTVGGLLTDGLTACLFKLRQDQAASAKALAIAAQLTAEPSTEAATAHSKALKAAA